jgi:hypothetical protein
MPYISLLLMVCAFQLTRKDRAYWIERHHQNQARIDAISSAVVQGNDQRVAAVDEGMANSNVVMIVAKDNRGLDGTVAAIFENDQLVLIKVESGSGDSEVTIRYYLENQRNPLVVAHTEVKKDGPAPHQETYRWYFAGGEYVTFRFSNPDEDRKFSPADRPEDIANIRSKIANYLELLGMNEPKSMVPYDLEES